MAAGQDKGHGAVSRRVLVASFAQGQGEFLSAVVIEEAEELGRKMGGGFTALESFQEECLALRNQRRQASAGRTTQSLAFLFGQCLMVFGSFDKLMTVVAAAMRGGLMGEFSKAWGICRSDVEQKCRERASVPLPASSASTSSSRLFLGELLSSSARLRFASRLTQASIKKTQNLLG